MGLMVKHKNSFNSLIRYFFYMYIWNTVSAIRNCRKFSLLLILLDPQSQQDYINSADLPQITVSSSLSVLWQSLSPSASLFARGELKDLCWTLAQGAEFLGVLRRLPMPNW